VEQVVEDLIAEGRVERAEGRTLVNEVMGRAKERSEGARSLVDASVQQGLRGAGVPTREDYEDLVFRVEQLEHRVRVLEGEDEESAAGGVEAASQPPQDESDTEPGL
jgi:polyhydroxyalkanoate synthesis regulator phasin